MSQEDKDRIMHSMAAIVDGITDLSTSPSKVQVDLIIGDLYEVMRMLSAMAEK